MTGANGDSKHQPAWIMEQAEQDLSNMKLESVVKPDLSLQAVQHTCVVSCQPAPATVATDSHEGQGQHLNWLLCYSWRHYQRLMLFCIDGCGPQGE